MKGSADPHALVIGAGLAGAAACVALARRGWRTTLLDAAPGPALAASGLPVGMLSPHVTRAPTALSRLSVLGVEDTRRELERLIATGSGWQPCEVDNLDHHHGRWSAALVRPGALVNAWLNEASALGKLRTVWQANVARLHRGEAASGGNASSDWQALDAQGALLGAAPVVVVASAHGSRALLQPLSPDGDASWLPLRPVKGQMSLGALNDGPTLMPRPQRQGGVFVPSYADSGLPAPWPTRLWAMGSTYARGVDDTHLTDQAHLDNARTLAAISPAAAEQFLAVMSLGELLGWAAVRCASLDRLPLVGALPDQTALQERMMAAGSRRRRLQQADVPRMPGLYVFAALGSRGLSLAHWCATRLAHHIDGAPDDADPDLVHALDPARFAWKQAKKQNHPARPP